MRGEWKDRGFDEFAFCTEDDRAHAVVRRDRSDIFKDKPWVAWTYYTEGNDRYSTVEEAQARACDRLRRLLEATESLR